jgi:hypothetical protein
MKLLSQQRKIQLTLTIVTFTKDRHEAWRGFPQVLEDVFAQNVDATVCKAAII